MARRKQTVTCVLFALKMSPSKKKVDAAHEKSMTRHANCSRWLQDVKMGRVIKHDLCVVLKDLDRTYLLDVSPRASKEQIRVGLEKWYAQYCGDYRAKKRFIRAIALTPYERLRRQVAPPPVADDECTFKPMEDKHIRPEGWKQRVAILEGEESEPSEYVDDSDLSDSECDEAADTGMGEVPASLNDGEDRSGAQSPSERPNPLHVID
ncbi:hypothetical protein KIPB_005199 [Kipferlia bialata]|uniref:Uncharacterized protein n=1 Tax=Kipferlia bialata TaxID=797122 RepID=A0A9K3GHZ8_9EUKA|nr:hypothetical protein KIPB_005199 [Kipferlia bialata]|eukprot:g5199.t1